MDALSFDLERAARIGRDRTLGDASSTAAKVNGAGVESAMADSAEHELFTEALLAAAKSKFQEIKTVTR